MNTETDQGAQAAVFTTILILLPAQQVHQDTELKKGGGKSGQEGPYGITTGGPNVN